MKKLLSVVILLSSSLSMYADDQRSLSAVGGFGAGSALIERSSSMLSLQYHVSVRYDGWTMKLSAVRNGGLVEIFDSPSELKRITTTSIVVGYSYSLYRPVMDSSGILSAVNVNLYSGWSAVKSVRSGDLDNSATQGLLSSRYQRITQSSPGVPVECELEWRMREFVGLTFGLYSNFNGIRNIHAIHISMVFGYF